MSLETPMLGRRDLRDEIGRIHSGPHRSRHTAFFGRADRDLQASPRVEAKVEGVPRHFRVVEVGSELALRRALSGAGEEEPLALLVTYGLDVPHDVAARLAKGQVCQIDRAGRLAARFEARSASAELLLEAPLVDAILDQGGDFGPVPGLAVDLDTAWRALLRRLTGRASADFRSEEEVVLFAATEGAGPDFARRAERWPGLRDCLHEWLRRTAGPVARLAWRARERDEGPRVAALALLIEACAGEVPRNGFLRGRLATVLESLDPELRDATGNADLLLRWGALAARLYWPLEAAGAIGQVLAEADRVLPSHPEIDGALAGSGLLPRAFDLARARLAEAVRAAAADPGRGPVAAAIAAWRHLERHRLAQETTHKPDLCRAHMAVRLLAWRHLAAQAVLERAEQSPPSERVPILAAWYAGEGSFVDYARRVARGSSADPLGGAVANVLEAVDSIRDGYDRLFAQALPDWQARRRAGAAVPIEEALDRFAVPFLEGGKHRKLLVLLLDGMAWANAGELLLDLERHGYGPTKQQRSRGGALEPMIAALPTITDVSRSAFFAGRLPKPGESLSTAGDPDRFANHRGLVAMLEGRSPKLLLSADAIDSGGGASKRARELIESDEERVVGIVLNAIDDQLKASGQLRVTYSVETITPLRDLLQAARSAGRAVLLAADHGHVPGARLERLLAPQATASRWRALGEGEPPRDREVVFSGDRAWHPRGKERVALLWAETDSYSSIAHEGEHGGASLAEVVAPAVFVAADTLARDLRAEGFEDLGLEVAAVPKPDFWTLELPKAVHAALQPPAKGAREPKRAKEQAPLPFLVPGTPAAPEKVTAPAAAVTTPEVQMLQRSAVFKAMLERRPRLKERKELILAGVGALLEGEGRLSPEVFADRTRTLLARVPGAVSILQEALNADGYPVVTFDPQEKLVKLDRETFRAVFLKDE